MRVCTLLAPDPKACFNTNLWQAEPSTGVITLIFTSALVFGVGTFIATLVQAIIAALEKYARSFLGFEKRRRSLLNTPVTMAIASVPFGIFLVFTLSESAKDCFWGEWDLLARAAWYAFWCLGVECMIWVALMMVLGVIIAPLVVVQALEN